jgi:putative alpha-1,2-mannosidase
MGFYPVCPGSDYYVIGSPCLPKVKYALPNGKELSMEAKGLSDKNIYVQSLKVNGKDWVNPFLPYDEIKDGGTLVFTMGPRPSRWGTRPVIPE